MSMDIQILQPEQDAYFSRVNKFMRTIEEARASDSPLDLNRAMKMSVDQNKSITPGYIENGICFLTGNPDDWNFTLHPGGNITIKQRIKDGMPIHKKEKSINNKVKTFVLETNSTNCQSIKFSNHTIYNTNKFPFPEDDQLPTRYSFSSDNDNSNGLYRNSEEYQDIVDGGGGNDTYRASKNMQYDVFYGGNGVDTLYIEGNRDNYIYRRTHFDKKDCIMIIDPTNTKTVDGVDYYTNIMYIDNDVERVRFSDGEDKNGYVSVHDLVDPLQIAGYKHVNKLGLKTGIVNLTQADDIYAWSCSRSYTLYAGWGEDELKLKPLISEISYLQFKFLDPDPDNYNRSAFVIYNTETKKTITCYDLEKITLPDGTTLTLQELKSKLDANGYIQST